MNSTPSLTIRLYRSLEELENRASEWNALVTESDIDTIYQTFEWHASWLGAFGHRVEPIILVVEEGNTLVGVAPLIINRRWFWGRIRRVVEFIGTSTSGNCDLIVKQTHPEARSLMLAWLIEHRDAWDAIDLIDLLGCSNTLETAESFFRQHGLRTNRRFLYQAPTRLLEDQWADWRAARSQNTRKQRNRLRRRGRIEFERLTACEEIASCLDTFYALHIQRRQITPMPSFFMDDANKVFYRNLVDRLAEKEQIALYVERLNQIPIAFGFALEYQKRLIAYQSTFDVNYMKFSPGTMLVMHMLDDAVWRGMREFDLAAGEQAYKFRITNHARTLYALRIFQHKADYGLMRLILGLKDQVSRSPRALALARDITNRLGIASQISTLR